MKKGLPLSLKIAAGFAATTCASFFVFFIAGQIYSFEGWATSWWSDLIFEGLTVLFWFFAFGTAIMTLIATWTVRQQFLAMQRELRSLGASKLNEIN